ncbi:uncharacterized protein CELE_C03B1.9 [Caenorhabditis elegans]|uniref:Uncharacterized protein C03B1.9 n=1 Tax=Caenorhabditis elegans TaxID=6239 RepID=YX09_CAEEL|nr:Uncharacterized protein CELE_C03B1.9 [Caenorhabditis elegans]Q11115.2 RecName: Full=Uncharacterized protein C03B1.9 [Caenorhabditis elegans]CCD62746.1 Uncharacterized protein CELE_C03B1.9 [Caenorhabditis elegans]|eukprot:NP_509063.2 Uncharacterized protein CELE_C03B1.9 [Caenorhabditis elegans]
MKEVEENFKLHSIPSCAAKEKMGATFSNESALHGTVLGHLLNLPNVNTEVLKAIYKMITVNGNQDKLSDIGISKFLTKWRTVYFSNKKPLIDALNNRFYDDVVNEEFEHFINKQNDNYMEARAEIGLLIELYHKDYLKSNFLNNDALEKLIILIIATDYMPMNFFPIFNYSCSTTDPSFKSHLLNSIQNLFLVGYEPILDKLLFI